MKYLKTFESKFTDSDKFKLWFEGSKIINPDGIPRIVYHGTNKQFKILSTKYSTQGIIWFASDKNSIINGEYGVSGEIIKSLYISMKNPAGWEEYEKLGLGQIKERGYDGVILSDGDDHYTGFVFKSNQIRIAK